MEHFTRMSWNEIQTAYPRRWVVLGRVEKDPMTLAFRGATVLGHGATRVAALSALSSVRDLTCTLVYTGAGEAQAARSWSPVEARSA